ncbi:hypothetical protein [Glycocaulis sp.]|uniref:hypothetical protein n=1 Tax=Glycocaulis sp. TaxID=1969725 RepID=UPI003F6ECB75
MRKIAPYLVAALVATIVVTIVRHGATQIQGQTVISIYNMTPMWLVVVYATLWRGVVLLVFVAPLWVLMRGPWDTVLRGLVHRRPILAGAVLVGLLGAVWVGLLSTGRRDLHLWTYMSPFMVTAVFASWVLGGAAWGAIFKLAGRTQPSKPAAVAE